MKQSILTAILSWYLCFCFAQTPWQPARLSLPTRWSKNVNPENALPEYPRPQMVRPNWTSLNGLWSYAIVDKDASQPSSFDGQILIPYPIESALSGVKKALLPSQNLWYKKIFTRPVLIPGERALIHFGAVDYEATVWINGSRLGHHEGGYTEFTFDITDALKTGDNELLVKVYDPTDQGVGPHGKQILNPANIYYTPTSGIWQTVWLETVPTTRIESLKLTPDIDHSQLNIAVIGNTDLKQYTIEAIARIGDRPISKKTITVNDFGLPVPNPRLWSPADPFLYDLTICLKYKGKVIDSVNSYFGMRKIAIAKNRQGIDRIFLNNKPYFNLGVLDQGFWPDGLYTAPTDEALAFDIQAIKAMGFNTIRKHIKVEPARWYYYTDKLGMLVWQDMVNPNQGLPEGAKQAFEQQCKETLAQLENHTSITTWVLFNEKWGQYDQKRLTEWIKHTDPSRLVNGHTGELLYVNDQQRSPSPDAYVSADMTDVHSYPNPRMPIKQAGKAQVLGEFGGIGVFIPDHQWSAGSAWGYIQEKPANLQTKYAIMVQHLKLLEKEGLSGSIYTQPFDVETEQNGLMTYDREVVKIPFDSLRRINSALDPGSGEIPQITAQDADLTDPALVYSRLLQQYIDGYREPQFLENLARLAVQQGDQDGASMIGQDYVATLHPPLTEEQIRAVEQFTKSTRDPGFSLIHDHEEAFKKVLGVRQLTVDMMNMIYRGEMEPLLENTDHPDWNAITVKVRDYGTPGEEILLRAKTVYFLNNQDWTDYGPAATAYLEKYGKNITEQESKMFRDAVDQHK
jgi:hypothetical protein